MLNAMNLNFLNELISDFRDSQVENPLWEVREVIFNVNSEIIGNDCPGNL